MSDQTPNLALPLLMPSQAQKHLTHNEALVALDALVHLSVAAKTATPPPEPADGARYLVEANGQGAFAGKDGQVAARIAGAWRFFAPRTGWIAWVAATSSPLAFDGLAWTEFRFRATDRLGIGAAADTGNRLAVASPAVLFDHAGADSRLKINKAASGDTASLLFQRGYSGRAEMGLAGSDGFRVKVSADGASWRDAFAVDEASGVVSVAQGLRIAEGAKVAAGGTGATAPLELEGGGSLGRVALVIKSLAGLTGALFEQRAAANSGIDLIDFGLKTLSHQVNLRIESRAAFSFTGAGPEFQVSDVTGGAPKSLFAVSARQAAVQSPLVLKSYGVAALPAAGSVQAGAQVYVTDAAGGAVPAFSDGTNWRRVTHRTVVS